MRLCKEWQRVMFDNGWAGIAWPKAYGGRGDDRVHQGIFNQEQARYDVQAGVFSVGIGMAGPTIIAHGTEEQKQRYLRPMLRGRRGVVPVVLASPAPAPTSVGCARRRCVTATSGSSTARRSGTRARTTATGASCSRAPIPMSPSTAASPTSWSTCARAGIDVRPLRQITGAAHFNEVFLTDVRIPHENIIGQVNAGWGPILTTLANERTLIGSSQSMVTFDDIVAFARHFGRCRRPDDPPRADAPALATPRPCSYLGLPHADRGVEGQLPGPESSVSSSRHRASSSMQGIW